MRFEHVPQVARGLGPGASSDYLRNHPIRELENSKWRLWLGLSSACRGRLAHLMHRIGAAHVGDVRGAATVLRHVNDRWTVQRFLDVRVVALIDTLVGSFK